MTVGFVLHVEQGFPFSGGEHEAVFPHLLSDLKLIFSLQTRVARALRMFIQGVHGRGSVRAAAKQGEEVSVIAAWAGRMDEDMPKRLFVQETR